MTWPRSHGTLLARFDSNAGWRDQRQWWYKYWRERSAATPVDQGRLVVYDHFLLFLVACCLLLFMYDPLCILLYLYLVVFILFWSFALVKQYCRIKKSASSRFWKDTLEVVQIMWSVHFWPQVVSQSTAADYWIPVSKSRKSFWFQAQGRWGQGLWFILVSPMQTLSSRYKSLRMQDNSRTKAWEKEWKKMLSILFTHRSPPHATASHDTLNHKHAVHRFRQTLSWTFTNIYITFTNNFQPQIKSNHALFSILWTRAVRAGLWRLKLLRTSQKPSERFLIRHDMGSTPLTSFNAFVSKPVPKRDVWNTAKAVLVSNRVRGGDAKKILGKPRNAFWEETNEKIYRRKSLGIHCRMCSRLFNLNSKCEIPFSFWHWCRLAESYEYICHSLSF